MTNDERYYKLRWLMGANNPKSWQQVEELGAIACYLDTDTFDSELDSIDVTRFEKMICGPYNYVRDSK